MTGNPAPPPLGRLLVERGLITEEELAQALASMAETGRHLGDTILELDLVPPNQISDLLAVQRAWRPLGWMLVERGLISEEQLSECLDDSEQTGRRLGDVVQARGLVSHRALEEVLAEQTRLEIELERGFGNGLREEIERRYRMKRPLPTDKPHPADPLAELWSLTAATPTPTHAPESSAPTEPASRPEQAGDQADEIRRLREALAERDATIRQLRQHLGEADAVAV